MAEHQYKLIVQFGSGKATTHIKVSRALTQRERDQIAQDIVNNFVDNREPYFEQYK